GLEDGVPSNSVPRSTAPSGISNPEKKMSCGTQCPNPQGLSSGPLTQKQNGFRTTEASAICFSEDPTGLSNDGILAHIMIDDCSVGAQLLF
ncbi:Brain and acute leukemia cytoplasmic protein, partial [Eschrichtius robustus]|nr:Brain and acute leukemia cytoplasmic protein [Eschrichtius robustus]